MQRLFPTFGPAGCTFLVPALISPKVSAACAAHFFFTWFCFARSHDLFFHYLYFVAVLKDTQNQTTNARYVLRKTGESNFQLLD